MNYSAALQTAIFQRLDATLSCPVYDAVPQPDNTTGWLPYVTVGDDTVVEWDTDTELGADCTITLHIWSRQRGRIESKGIEAEIYQALHRAERVVELQSGLRFVGIDFERSESFLDSDGLTRHSVCVYRARIEAVEATTV